MRTLRLGASASRNRTANRAARDAGEKVGSML
jgi:hypothetical protein